MRPVLNRLVRDEEGMTLALVALLIMALLASFGFLIDINTSLFRRQQMQNMAELGAAAGGRFIAEAIAIFAEGNVCGQADAPEPPDCDPPPSADEKKHPERHLRDWQRDALQTNDMIKAEVKRAVLEYAEKNRPEIIPKGEVQVEVIYPETSVDCRSPTRKNVDIKAIVRYTHPFILGKLATAMGAKEKINLAVAGRYAVRICP